MRFCLRPSALVSLAFSGAALALTGCGFTATPVSSTSSLHFDGTVMGGQQPVVGSLVKLYIAGNSGNGSQATDILGTGTGSPLAYATTDNNGKFSISGDYTCPAATSSYTPQAYLVATGGNPGLNPATINNSALVMVDALGACSNLQNMPTVSINELTTVAAAWALAAFVNPAPSIGSPATNIGGSPTNVNGLANAFLNAQLITDPATGVTPGSALPTGNTLEGGKITGLADIIATCVNSDGTTPCQTLYTTSGQCTATCTSDTFAAALYIVQHPAQQVGPLFGLIPANQPYTTTLATAPHDWTLSMTITTGGLSMPTELALDSAGNVWVADYYGAVSAFNPQGTALSPSTGFGSGVIKPELFGLAVDGSNNVWVDIQENPSGLSGLYGITSGQTLGSVISVNGSTITTSNYVYFPEELATAQNGSIIVGNNGSSTASIFNYTPANGIVFTLGNAGAPYSAEPTDVSGDANGGVWLADQGSATGTVTHVDANGNLLSHPTCCSVANGIGTDKLGNAWVANYGSNSVSEVLPGCDSNASPNAACYGNQQNVITIGADSTCGNPGAASTACGDTNGGTYTPIKVVVDAAQNIWLANYHGRSFTSLAGNFNTQPAGYGFSPPTTFDANGNVLVQGGYGLDAKLLEPFDIAPDASGNLWISNEGYDNLVMFFGLAAPTATPRRPTPVAP